MPRAPVSFRLYLITDRNACGARSLVEVLEEACTAGVRAVQLREKDLSARQIFDLALQVKRVTDSHGVMLFINDRADVARGIEATGVHLTTSSLPASVARKCLLPHQLIGVSTHSMEDAVLAEKEGADFVCFGPVYDTPSKRAYGPPKGLSALAQVARSIAIPVFAIGGVTPERVKECLAAGAWGVAVISSIIGAPDVADAVRCFDSAFKEARTQD